MVALISETGEKLTQPEIFILIDPTFGKADCQPQTTNADPHNGRLQTGGAI